MNDILSIALSTMIQTSLIGEWAKVGMCDKERKVFTSTEKYFEIEKKIGGWKSSEIYSYDVIDTVINVKKSSNITASLMKVEAMTLGSIDYCSSENNSWNCSNDNYLEKCGER
tara:strand:+ start:719 stop:1057 length:339 start_codon:yes stop_codon:yes gene_type:complete